MERALLNVTEWDTAAAMLAGFGGDEVTLHVPKTGMPFFDALRLYGAIDLYIGVREDVYVRDRGEAWIVAGRARPSQLSGRDLAAYQAVRKSKKTDPTEYCQELRETVLGRKPPTNSHLVEGKSDWDAALQTGVRGTSAYKYETLQSGQTSKHECKAFVSLSDAVLAYAGKRRIERLGDITFLPIFEGPVDLSKVVSPLRARVAVPNVLCAQALALLMLKTSLFAEGYQDRLQAVVFKTNLGRNRSDNYSGVVIVSPTAIGRARSGEFLVFLLRTLRELVRQGWQRQGRDYRSTEFTQDALTMAYWLLEPSRQHLSAMIGSQERLRARGAAHILNRIDYVREVFSMSYGDWNGDHEAVRMFARTVASAIYYARMVKEQTPEDQRKAWYDEITVLRSAPSAKAFLERALILIEQGHREYSLVGTARRGEAFAPASLLNSIGSDRVAFETFRDLFRMYLVQESTPRGRSDATDAALTDETGEEEAE